MFFVITLTPLKVSFQLKKIYDSFLPSSLPFRCEILLLTVRSAAVGQRGKISEKPGRGQRSRTVLCQLSSCAWSQLTELELWLEGETIPQDETCFVKVQFSGFDAAPPQLSSTQRDHACCRRQTGALPQALFCINLPRVRLNNPNLAVCRNSLLVRIHCIRTTIKSLRLSENERSEVRKRGQHLECLPNSKQLPGGLTQAVRSRRFSTAPRSHKFTLE